MPRDTVAKIRRVVFATTGETGVRLVGYVRGRHYVVRHVIGPGPRVIRRANFYECDNHYSERVFASLLDREPGLLFLGELHVHTDGEMRLSAKDRATVRNVLAELPFFIAGTIRRRPFGIAPVLFRRGEQAELACVLR